MRLLPGLLHRNKQAGASLRERTCMNLVFMSFCTGLKVDGTIFRTSQCFIDGSTQMLVRNAVGARMGLSVPVPNGYLTVVFN